MIDNIGTDVARAARLLQDGVPVAIPTETVYGLAANALDADAVRQIFEIKGRPSTNPLIVHVADMAQVADYVSAIPTVAEKLMERFWPGPLTVVLPRKKSVPDIVTAGRETVAIRVPAHPIAQQLLKLAGIPLAAPSANPSGYISPTTAAHVQESLGDRVSYILDGGACDRGIESTIVGFDDDVPVILRHGVITAEHIRQVVGDAREYSGSGLLAPGMSASHYSPRTPLVLTENIEAEISRTSFFNVGVITYAEYARSLPTRNQLLISADGGEEIAARKLYAAMHEMDKRGFDVIIVKRFPHRGIGVALNDRLHRAASRYVTIGAGKNN